MTRRFSCARSCRDRSEPLLGTASTVQRWVAVERPGPWGTDALTASRMDTATGDRLRELGRRLRTRVVLIRRYGGRSSGRRHVLVADAAPDVGRLEQLIVDDPAELLDGRLSGLARGAPVGGELLGDPRFLVCTHGSHDACCAEFGRPVAAAVDEIAGDRAWESSHIGGDRFAANVVVLPHGVYYGRVTPEEAADVVAAHDAGRIALDNYRGRVCYPFPVQAAEGSLRRELGADRVDAVRLVAAPSPTGNVRTACFDVADHGRFEVEVALRATVGAHRLTCRSESALHPPSYQLVGLRRLGRAAGPEG